MSKAESQGSAVGQEFRRLEQVLECGFEMSLKLGTMDGIRSPGVGSTRYKL